MGRGKWAKWAQDPGPMGQMGPGPGPNLVLENPPSRKHSKTKYVFKHVVAKYYPQGLFVLEKIPPDFGSMSWPSTTRRDFFSEKKQHYKHIGMLLL